MKRILFPVEDLNISEKALALVIAFGRNYGAEVLLLHVQPFNVLLYSPYGELLEPWDEEAFRHVSERIVGNAANKLTEAGLTVIARILSGDPATEILECAMEDNCDMIIMSTHGMNTTKQFRLGSVTNKVVLHAKIPVLVVR